MNSINALLSLNHAQSLPKMKKYYKIVTSEFDVLNFRSENKDAVRRFRRNYKLCNS